MDKIAGPYYHTLAGILGDKRSTMLESELQYTVSKTYYYRSSLPFYFYMHIHTLVE